MDSITAVAVLLVGAVLIAGSNAQVASGFNTTLTPEQEARINAMNKECQQVTGVAQNLIDDAKKGIFAEDPKLKSHAFCFAKKINFQDNEGSINLSVVRDRLSKEITNKDTVEAIITKCLVGQGTPELTAFNMLTCMHRTVPKGVVYVR